jgi:hypothetical protein
MFLLGGWVLMHPPIGGEMAPFPSGWTHYMSFDTARECEQARMGDLKLANERNTGGGSVAEFLDARCVPVDVVYPRPSPGQK